VNKLTLELIPILAIKKASEALNITDISPLHVSYVLGKTKKNKNLSNEIKLAKAFCYAADCYGAESYIRGFSGYALEVLVSHYGSFMKFLTAAVKWNTKEKIIVDPRHYYKSKQKLLEEMNEAKLLSPIILVDPVQKERNACAALSFETLKKFIEISKKFLKSPKEFYFFKEKIDINKLKSAAKKARAKFITLKA
jgi:tRNA nucleotidyltransferase (CCA-adding enzyme)